MNFSVFASAGKKSLAKVVLPAPLGPEMMMIFSNWMILIYVDLILRPGLNIAKIIQEGQTSRARASPPHLRLDRRPQLNHRHGVVAAPVVAGDHIKILRTC